MARKRKQIEYVIGLITGRFEMSKTYNTDGDRVIQTTFVPTITNDNPPLSYVMKTNEELSRQQVLEKEALIYPSLIVSEEDYKKKSDFEKQEIKQLKSNVTNKRFKAHLPFHLWKELVKFNQPVYLVGKNSSIMVDLTRIHFHLNKRVRIYNFKIIIINDYSRFLQCTK
jgi:hypothetical protein